MSKQSYFKSILVTLSLAICLFTVFSESAKANIAILPSSMQVEKSIETNAKSSSLKEKNQNEEGSPTEAVRTFYSLLRQRRFREAMLMTNLHYAVEGLSEAELKDLSSDFEPLAAQVPEVFEVRGEIITNNLATVTAILPDDETRQPALTEIELRREKNSWVILSGDADAEAVAKKEGKNYFFVLRMDIHHNEAQTMMERIAKAETVYSLQNGGLYGDLPALIEQTLLPDDINSTQSTGYKYTITILEGGKKYVSNATPDIYGRTGKLSFLLQSEGSDRQARLKYSDNKGNPLKK